MTGPIWFLLQNLEAGGAERVFVNLTNHLSRRGIPVCLVVLNAKGILREQVAQEVRLIDLRVNRVRYAALSLVRALRKERPSAVLSTLDHLNLLVGMIRPFFPGIRFYCRETAIPSLQFRLERWPFLYAFLCRRLYPGFKAIICQSASIVEDLKKNFLGSGANLTLIHNPVDVDQVRRLADAEGDPFKGNDRVIIVVGRFAPQKQFDFLPDLLKRILALTKASLHMLGDGPMRLEVEKAFEREGLSGQVKFWGVQSNPYRFMRHARVLVLVSKYEGFPNVVVEANAAGIPAISFRCPGVTEEVIADGKNGYLVAPGDLNAMAAHVVDILENRKTFPSASVWVSDRFGIETIASQYSALLTGGSA